MSLQSMSLREAWAPRVVCCFGGALAKAKHETTAVANLSQHVNMSTCHNTSGKSPDFRPQAETRL